MTQVPDFSTYTNRFDVIVDSAAVELEKKFKGVITCVKQVSKRIRKVPDVRVMGLFFVNSKICACVGDQQITYLVGTYMGRDAVLVKYAKIKTGRRRAILVSK